MKTKMFLTLMLGASLAVVSCKKGDTGEMGPKGDTGAQGPAGTAGVQYSNWIEVKEANWIEKAREITPDVSYTDYNSWTSASPTYTIDKYIDTSIRYEAEIPTPKITQDVLDKGVVFFYFKDMTAPANGKIYPFQPWDSWSVGMTNRTTDFSYYSYFSIDNANDNGDLQKDKLTLRTYYYGSGAYYDASLNKAGQSKYYYLNYGNAAKRIKYSELKPKTHFAIRYVVIPAGTPTGRVAPVDMSNYEAVKAYYKIKD